MSIFPKRSSSARQHFRDRNIMTPHILRHYVGKLDGKTCYIELSRGEGISREPIFGVTVTRADWHRDRACKDASKLFESEQDALRYINATF